MASAGKVVKLRNIKRALSLSVPKDNVSFILSGRISNFRSYKSFNFIDLTDGSTKEHLQAVVSRQLVDKPELGAYVICQGSLVPSRGQLQSVEFRVEQVNFLGRCDPTTYPLATSSQLSNNWFRQFTHLRPRAAHFGSLLRVKSELELGLHMIMKQMDFFRVHAPILTSNDSEASSDLFLVKRSKISNHLDSTIGNNKDSRPAPSSGTLDGGGQDSGAFTQTTGSLEDGEDYYDDSADDKEFNSPLKSPTKSVRLVRDDYFNKDVFLITSAQLHLENLAASLSRVYSLSNCFRAENSISTRHLCEFLMFELEEANLTELEPLMNRAESVVKFIAQYLAEISDQRADFESLVERNENAGALHKLAESAFIRMSYEEAMRTLSTRTDFAGDTSYGADIGRLHEKKLLEYSDNVPIFVTHYPRETKPFYMKCDERNEKALCFDLIAPHGGEICAGSLREESWQKLQSNLELRQTAQDSMAHFNWYLDSRRFGSFPHGGFGMGIERLLQSLLGIKNIRDATAFPRWTGHCPM